MKGYRAVVMFWAPAMSSLFHTNVDISAYTILLLLVTAM
jgi:hypothetical protein